LRLLEALLQRGTATEGSGPGTGADAQAVLGHPVEIDQVLFQQDGDAAGQQVVEELQVRDPEIGQGVIIGLFLKSSGWILRPSSLKTWELACDSVFPWPQKVVTMGRCHLHSNYATCTASPVSSPGLVFTTSTTTPRLSC
jgi:hypothetical protein